MEQEDNKQTKRWINIFIAFLFLCGIAFFAYGFILSNNSSNSNVDVGAPIVSPTIAITGYVSYKGHVGFNALELLKAVAQVEESAPGLVIGINGRKPDVNQAEHWGFYVNGKISQTGPALYQTQDGDFIEWKIERN